jgi:hypothetical protein
MPLKSHRATPPSAIALSFRNVRRNICLSTFSPFDEGLLIFFLLSAQSSSPTVMDSGFAAL